MGDDLRERAAVLALVSVTEREWHRTAALIEEAGGAVRLLAPRSPRPDAFDAAEIDAMVAKVTPDVVNRYVELIQSLAGQGIRTVTVLDHDYPVNLREVYNRPPMLFIKGDFRDADQRAVAVVGTRNASRAGVELARLITGQLAKRGITVLSGLARGIDAAAHEATLEAGGRTVAVMGTGINQVYPPENRDLAARIHAQGALVSQFWPDAPPTRYSFPLRNVVMSGMSIGTVVIEAGSTSGAKMQARFALEHGKRLFLVESLVMQQDWARRYAKRPGTVVVRSADQIVGVVETLLRPAQQLSLAV